MKKVILKNAAVYEEISRIENGVVVIEGESIAHIGYSFQDEELAVIEDSVEVIELPATYHVIPGMIDLHIHGAGGADTMDGTFASLETIAALLPEEGTTSFLPTTMTQSDANIEKALKNIASYSNVGNSRISGEGNGGFTDKGNDGGSEEGNAFFLAEGNRENSGKGNGDFLHKQNAEVLGVHLEGPFINYEMAGAQPKEFISKIDIDKFKRWQELSGNAIKIVTFAPEMKGSDDFVRYLAGEGIVAAVGHSNASYSEVQKLTEEGLSHATHLFNQMRGLHHREPGIVGAAFLLHELSVELIVDGLHVSREAVQLSYQTIGPDRLILITDAMRAKGMGDGIFDLGGQSVNVSEGKAVLEDGTLAGSVLKMSDAIKNMICYTGCTLRDIIKMAAVNPAKKIGVFDRKGSIAVGKDADLVVLNESYEVVMTFCRGKLVYQKGC